MAILVDEAIWSWRGRKWAHLISDTHPDELHDFAQRLGLPYLAFQGDHYDVHLDMRRRALDAGARPVAGREVVIALRNAGLRRRGPVESWIWTWRETPTDLAEFVSGFDDRVAEEILRLAGSGEPLQLGHARRAAEDLLVASSEHPVAVDSGLTSVDERTWVHRSTGERGTYIEWRTLIG